MKTNNHRAYLRGRRVAGVTCATVVPEEQPWAAEFLCVDLTLLRADGKLLKGGREARRVDGMLLRVGSLLLPVGREVLPQASLNLRGVVVHRFSYSFPKPGGWQECGRSGSVTTKCATVVPAHCLA
jgi:hypothetical protein